MSPRLQNREAAVIGILAAIAVPSFFRESRKAKGSAEVKPIFNDLRSRMEQFIQENGTSPATIGEGALHPTAPTAAKRSIFPLPATWTALRVRPTGNGMVYCGYTCGSPASRTTPPTSAPRAPRSASCRQRPTGTTSSRALQPG